MSRVRIPYFLLAAAATIAVVGSALALVHDGRSFAIEAGLPHLEKEENPFVLRQMWWHGELKVGEKKIISHQLFKRNDYWFWAGLVDEDSEISIHIYDGEGNLVEAESWQKGNVAGARIVPEKSGSYLIAVQVIKAAETPAEWAVVYAYR